jgi:hypothetical protein
MYVGLILGMGYTIVTVILLIAMRNMIVNLT